MNIKFLNTSFAMEMTFWRFCKKKHFMKISKYT